MTYIIPNPETKKHLQDNKSDHSGTIYQSRNISLDEEGYIKLAEASFAQYTTDNDADFDTVDAVYPSSSEIFMNSSEIFSGTAGFAALTNRSGNTGVPTPGVEEDIIYFNGTEVSSDGTTIYYRSASTTWTSVSTSLNASFPTSFTVFDGANSLAIGNNNTVKFVNTSWAVNGTVLTLPNEYQVSSLKSIGNTLYIATRSKSGGDARLFLVGSIKTSADYSYPVGTFELATIKSFKSSIVGVNSLGELVRFNGGGFDVLGVLPIYKTGIEWGDAQNDYSTVSNRAMITDGDLIYINLSSFTQNGRYQMLPNFPSGVWCYDDENGSLYHRYSPSFSKYQEVSGSNVTVNATNNNFTLTSGNLNSVFTGMPVFYSDGGGTAIPELKNGGVAYYIIKDSSTVFRLATSYTNAIAGTPIDITGTGAVQNLYYIILTNDYGWTLFPERMSVAVLNNLLFDSNYVGRIAMTADLFSKTDNSSDKTVFSPISPFIPNRGYVTTPRLTTASIKEEYNTIGLKYKPLGDDDKIIIKAKYRDRIDYPMSSVQFTNSDNWVATWTDSNTFTSVADLSGAEEGDEVELIAGVGSGHIAHISSLAVNGATWTVNLEDPFAFVASGDKFYYKVDNFKKLAVVDSNTSPDNVFHTTIPEEIVKQSKFAQFKLELRGIDTIIEEFSVGSKGAIPILK